MPAPMQSPWTWIVMRELSLAMSRPTLADTRAVPPISRRMRTSPGRAGCGAIGSGGDPDRADLDRIWPDHPVRVQYRSGALSTLNGAAIDRRFRVERGGRRSGQLWRADRRLRMLLEGSSRMAGTDLVALGRELARYGITHLNGTPDLTPEFLAVFPSHCRNMWSHCRARSTATPR
jgi:hypothetical protein